MSIFKKISLFHHSKKSTKPSSSESSSVTESSPKSSSTDKKHHNYFKKLFKKNRKAKKSATPPPPPQQQQHNLVQSTAQEQEEEEEQHQQQQQQQQQSQQQQQQQQSQQQQQQSQQQQQQQQQLIDSASELPSSRALILFRPPQQQQQQQQHQQLVLFHQNQPQTTHNFSIEVMEVHEDESLDEVDIIHPNLIFDEQGIIIEINPDINEFDYTYTFDEENLTYVRRELSIESIPFVFNGLNNRFFNADVLYASVEGESYDQHNFFHYTEEYQEDEEIRLNITFSKFKKVFSKLKMYVKKRIKVLMQMH
ncbi:hypothetical protein KGF54_005535 [Candida jiufengensis]|uniref:uncharacterized protein n=1 Tax=Candida jiufengensis TaxID=497108 RepID=UPI002224E516|nr:uncharacterized protein KGF54_005535 [Candida jiufengensis]KAI5949300.1 hypothetical protein KGF54_005535 [Candida jiufengensis]